MALEENEDQRKAAAAIFGKTFVDRLIAEGNAKTLTLEQAGIDNKEKTEQGNKMSRLGAWLASKREEVEMSVSDLAKVVEMPAEVINAIESGAVYPGMDMLELLAKALGATAKELAGVMAEDMGMAGETEEDEMQAAPPVDLDTLAKSLAGLMQVNVDPLTEAINGLQENLKGLAGRLDRLESKVNLKQKTEMPRYYFGLTRASQAAEAEVKDGDDLKDKKPVESTAVKPGRSMAAAYFPSAK